MYYEDPVIMMKQIKTSSVFVDVGANIGLLSHPVAVMPQHHTVIALEPVPSMVNAICITKKILGLPNMIVHAAAASELNGNTTFFVPKGRADNTASTNSAALLNVKQQQGIKESEQVNVETIRLDQLLKHHKIKRVALLKIDTQGHELFVLRGAIESLRSRVIQAVYAENDEGLTSNQGVKPTDIFAFMTELGWKLYKVGDYVIENDTIKPKNGTVPLISLKDAGMDVLWLPA